MNLLITGVSNYLGQAVVHRLIRDNPFLRVFGVDRKPPRVLGPVRYVPADVLSEAFAELVVVNDIQAVLHLAFALSPPPVRDEVAVARRLVEVAGIAGVGRLVFVSRDQVFEAGHGACAESARLSSPRSLPPEVQGKALIEAEVGAGEAAERVVTVRIGNLIGRDRGAPLDRLLSLPFVIAPRRGDPLVQFLQAEDAAEVLVRAAATPHLRGCFNAAGAGPVPLSTVAGILEKSTLRLPGWLMAPALGLLTRTHQLTDGQRALRELHQGVPMTCTRLGELGFTPRYTTRQALAVWRAGRPLQGRELA